MADLGELRARCEGAARDLRSLISSGKKILVVTHIDADGIASGSTVFAALLRKGANAVVRCVPDLDRRVIAGLEAEKFDYHIFTDLGSTLVRELEASLDGRFLVIDHHQLSPDDMEKPSVINAWKYGFDGGKDACSSSMAYVFATSADSANGDLAPLAVVGAVADRQDGGPNRSLTGLNRVALEEAQSAGLVSVSKDLMFTGRETRPVHEAIAVTSTPYLKGITGSKDAVLAALHQSGLRLKDGGSWRTLSSFDGSEKMKVTEVIAGMLGTTQGATEAIASLVGEVYTLEYEDSFTPLRDAREFATLLNACGRMGATGVGVSVCLGERSEAMRNAIKTLGDYRMSINRALQGLGDDPSRTETQGSLVFVRGEGIVDERLLGPVTSILTSSPGFKDKVVVARTSSRDSELKISARVGDEFVGSVNLGVVMREAAEAAGGVGGGHSMAAGARIPSSEAEPFIGHVREKVLA